MNGIFICIWGDKAYGESAYNLAMSLKFYSPNIPIHLLTQPDTVKGIPLEYFDNVEYYHHPVTDPGLFKSQIYEKLPFQYTLFLDADALCVAPVEPLFEKLINEGKPYRCFVHTFYGKESPNAMPLMVWADRDVIWNHYGLDNERLPATQSSLQFIQKGDWCEQMFLKFQQNFSNPIPLHKLKNAWGGGQPDELYLNVTLAQLNYDPSIETGIYFGNEYTLRPHQIKEKHQFLSMFGTANNIKAIFVNYYDGELEKTAKHFGHRTFFKWKNISFKKHANKRMPNMSRTRRARLALSGPPFQEERFKVLNLPGKTLLCTSYYETGNPIRDAEFSKCRDLHLISQHIDHILNLGTLKVDHPRVTNISYERPTYEDFLKEAKKLNYDYTVIANSDIYFDESLNWIKQIKMDKTMIALTRWDMDNNGFAKFFNYEWSQDVWIFKDLPEGIGKYFLGLPGCDNKFAYEAELLGFKVLNPSKDIKTYHVHNSNARNYGEQDRLPPPYKEVAISSIKGLLKESVCIHQPGKVGDIINTLPIAKYLSKDRIVYWALPKQYWNLLPDYVIPVENPIGKVIDLSFGLNRNAASQKEWERVRKEESFVSLKYRLAGVPISELRNLDYKRRIPFEISLFTQLDPKEKYALVHDSSDYGTPINPTTDLKVIKFVPHNGYTIFDWRKVIENATEIHCIDSSLCNFVDCLDVKAKKFYYKTDRVPLKGDETILTKEWTRVNLLEYASS